MKRDLSILVTGASGMVGSAVCRNLAEQRFDQVLAPPRFELDLLDGLAVERYFRKHRPEFVFLLAARVGGIAANAADPAGFLSENGRMIRNLFEAIRKFPPRKALFAGSSCVYPRGCPQPMQEEFLWTGPFEPTNEGFAVAKAMGLRLAAFHERQFGVVTVCPILCNVYGTNDTFDPERSHVLSALVRKFVDAADGDLASVTLWGTGAPRRDFLHVDDAARALVLLMDQAATSEPLNVGPGRDISIRELAERIGRLAGFRGKVRWDPARPDGMPRKCLDVRMISTFGFREKIGLSEGVSRTIGEYRALKASGKLQAGNSRPAPRRKEQVR
jgi:GDP-L-fucose synthase